MKLNVHRAALLAVHGAELAGIEASCLGLWSAVSARGPSARPQGLTSG